MSSILPRHALRVRSLRGVSQNIRQLSVTPGRYDDATGTTTKFTTEALKGMDISPADIESVSESGIVKVTNTIAGWFSGGDPSSVVFFDTVQTKLGYLYVPYIYESVQGATGLSWMSVVMGGSLCVRLLLFPITRRTMRMQRLMREVLPKMQSYDSAINMLVERRKTDEAEKMMKWKQNLMKAENSGSVILCALSSSFLMIYINRSLRHLSHVTPLMEGGVGPFLDISANGNSAVAFCAMPLIMVSGLATVGHLNFKMEKWYNPRIAVIGLPVAGLFVYGFSKFSLVLSMHYAVSSWFTVGLFALQRWEPARSRLDLPPVYREIPPPPLPSLSARKTEMTARENKMTAREPEMMAKDQVENHAVEELEEPLIELRSEETTSPPPQRDYPYTPLFQMEPVHPDQLATPTKATEVAAAPVMRRSDLPDNCYVPPPKGRFRTQMDTLSKSNRPKFWERFKHWRYRQRLSRHGRKGIMKEFIDEAPFEQKFIRDPVQLTTKVTPGLKRYVLRRQYPTDTIAQNERYISYIERVQNQRW